ncbi:OsmC-like protein [compost metagenome]
MVMDDEGKGRFTEIVLRPRITITGRSEEAVAAELHEDAHESCFIANSVNFPVRCEPEITKV